MKMDFSHRHSAILSPAASSLLPQSLRHKTSSRLRRGTESRNPLQSADLTEGVELLALWCQSGVPFRDDFLTLNQTHYQAKPNGVDFVGATEQAWQTINGSVDKQTQDKIKELLKRGILKPTTRLVLTNAIFTRPPSDL
jgi:serine protease inhibitor